MARAFTARVAFYGATTLSERKPFLLRIDSQILEGVQRWANDDLRSLNAQIEYLLRKALKESKRARVNPDEKTGQPEG